MFQTLLYQPLYQFLLRIYEQVDNLGIAIILLTLGIRFILLPLTLPSLKAMSKMRDIQPEIDKLKKKFKNDKTSLQQAQMDLFKKHGVNPAAGCLPQIFQIVIFIGLYRVFIDFLQSSNTQLQNTAFLGLNLTQHDPTYILPLVAGISQLILGLMMSPGPDTTQNLKAVAQSNEEKPEKEEQKEDFAAMSAGMQQQMIIIMPLFTIFIAAKFPSGLALYWVVTTIFSLVQQYFATGWGGLPKYLNLVRTKIGR